MALAHTIINPDQILYIEVYEDPKQDPEIWCRVTFINGRVLMFVGQEAADVAVDGRLHNFKSYGPHEGVR